MFYKKPEPKKTTKSAYVQKKPQSALKDMKIYEIPYAEHFRGFKRFPVVVHGDVESEKNNELIYDKDFSTFEYRFICFTGKNGRMAFLYADKCKIGAIFDDDQIYAIEHNKIEKIHLEPREEIVLGNKRTEKRHRVSVIVKYRE